MSQVVYVNKDECTSCAQCSENVPEVFQMDDDGYASVHDSNGADTDTIQEEIDSCPGEAIHWED